MIQTRQDLHAKDLMNSVTTTVTLDFEVKKIGQEYMDEIMKLQNIIYKEIKNKEIFHPNTAEENLRIIQSGGHILGVFFRDQLVAFRIVDIPGLGKSNLGKDIGLSKKELQQVAIFDTTIVHPNFRGHKLQFKTLVESKKILVRQGYRHGCSTISPNNLFSVRNLLKAGFVIKQLKKKYGKIHDEIDGKLRYILHIDLKKTVQKNYQKIVHIKNYEIEKQKMLLNNGFEGFMIVAHNSINDFEIAYGK